MGLSTNPRLRKAILIGATISLCVTSLLQGLLFTAWRGFAVKAFGPSIELVRKIDPLFFAKPYSQIKILVVSFVIYFLIALTATIVIKAVTRNT